MVPAPAQLQPTPTPPLPDDSGTSTVRVPTVRDNLRGAVWRLAIFMTVCALALVAMLAIFAQLRFEKEKTYTAEFSNVSGLESGNFVRIAGVEVGKVKRISIRDDATALVEFGTDDSVVLTEGSRAVVRYRNLIGDRYLALEEGAGGTRQLAPGRHHSAVSGRRRRWTWTH